MLIEPFFEINGLSLRLNTAVLFQHVLSRFAKWDTPGHIRFKAVTVYYFRGVRGIILLYDITDRESFNSIPNWVGEVRSVG
jgi:GTPase SAR1 family protein